MADTGVHEMQVKIREFGDELDALHKQLHTLGKKLEALERDANQAGLLRVVASIRDAYVNLTQAGQALVEAHLNLNIPPGAWKGQAVVEVGPPQGEETPAADTPREEPS